MTDLCTSIHLSLSPYGSVSCWNSNCLTIPDTWYSAGSLWALSYTHLGLPACPSFSYQLALEDGFLQMCSLEVIMPHFARVQEFNGSDQVLIAIYVHRKRVLLEHTILPPLFLKMYLYSSHFEVKHFSIAMSSSIRGWGNLLKCQASFAKIVQD